MLISFIIPVYNVEKYLHQCIESILSQTYKDIEVILVDDGSKDSSGAICDDYSSRYDRIQVIHKVNGGLSDARNVGLLKACGDYVIFLDSDDFWINENSLQNLVNILRNNPKLEFIGFNCSYYYSESNTYRKWVSYDMNVLNESTADGLIPALVKTGTFPMSACLKIIKRKFLIDNGIFFRVGITAEDIPWFLDLLYHATNIKYINDYIYAYRQNVVGSITNSTSSKSYYNLFSILQGELRKIEAINLKECVRQALLSFMAYEYCILLAMSRKLGLYESECHVLAQYKYLLKYKLNPKVEKVFWCNKILGMRLTSLLLNFYLQNK